MNKISLSCFYDKIFVLDDEKTTGKKGSYKKKGFSQMITNKNKCVQIRSR